MIKKADMVLAVFLLLSGLLTSFVLSSGSETGQTVEITIKGKRYASYDLIEDHSIVINKKDRINKINIKGGKVAMTFSNCKGKDCVNQGQISKTSQSIACLPHQVLIEIKGKNPDYDAISH